MVDVTPLGYKCKNCGREMLRIADHEKCEGPRIYCPECDAHGVHGIPDLSDELE